MVCGVARADNCAMRRLLLLPLLALALVPAALAEPRAQTISGTVTANSGSSITVTSGDRSVTCAVLGAKAQAAIARWGVGAKAGMACRQAGKRLVLAKLNRADSTEGSGPTTTEPRTTTEPATTTPTPPSTVRRDDRGTVSALGGGTITVTRGDGSSLTCTVSEGQARSIGEGAPVGTAVLIVCAGDGSRPALLTLERLTTTPPAAPPPPAPAPAPVPANLYAKGVVTLLSSDGVTVKPDDGTTPAHCRITTAADSAAAAAKLSLGAHVGIVCRLDGTAWVLFGSTPLG